MWRVGAPRGLEAGAATSTHPSTAMRGEMDAGEDDYSAMTCWWIFENTSIIYDRDCETNARRIVCRAGSAQHADCQCATRSSKFNRNQYLAYQYGSRVKRNVVPVTIGALAPTNDTLTSLT